MDSPILIRVVTIVTYIFMGIFIKGNENKIMLTVREQKRRVL